MSSLARIFGVFHAPAATFEDIAREPHFILCWIVIIACSELFGYAMLTRIGPATLARQIMMASPRAQAMPADQLNQTIATMARFASIQFLALPPVFIVCALLILAGIFLAAVNFLLGQSVRYKGVLGVVSYAFLPQALGALAAIAVLYTKADPSGVNFQYVIGSSAAFYADPTATSPVLMALLGHLDLFVFWTMGLLALGLAKLGTKLKFSTALATVVGLWVLYLLISVGVTAITA